MHWLERKSKVLIGVDISTRYIKLIELARINGSIEVKNYAVAELPMVVLTESNEIKDPATISSTIIALRDSIGITSKNAAIALPGASVVTKQIFLDSGLKGKELENQVWLEAGKYFPDLIEDLSLDFDIIGLAEHDKSKNDILLVACRKTSIKKRVEVLENSQLQVKIVDVDYYALERAFRYILRQHSDIVPEHTYALLNFSSGTSTVVVIKNNQLLYAYDQSFETEKLLQKLQEEQHWPNILLHPTKILSIQEATIAEAIEELLVNHIRYVLELFYSSKPESSIQHLYLSGDCAQIPGVAQLIEQALSMHVNVANPLQDMKIASHIDATSLQASAAMLTLCCGLALHGGVR